MLWAQTPLQSWHKHPAAVTMAVPPLPAFQLQQVKPGGCSHYIFARKLHTQIRNDRWRKRDLLIYSREKRHLQTSRSKMSTNSRNTKSIRNKKMKRFIKRGGCIFCMYACLFSPLSKNWIWIIASSQNHTHLKHILNVYFWSALFPTKLRKDRTQR